MEHNSIVDCRAKSVEVLHDLTYSNLLFISIRIEFMVFKLKFML